MIKAHKKPHVCDNCGKRFKIEARYKRHSLICKDQNQNGNDHEKKKIPNLCSYCGKSYASKSSLWSHVAIVHEGKKPTCLICSEAFERVYSLKKHMALKHDGETYECFICNSKFFSKKRLNGHISYTHEGKRPSKQKQTCSVCNATYSDSYKLKKHIESVHEGKTYQCSYYGEVLKTKGSLEGHIPMDHTKSFAKLFTVQSKL